MAGLPSNGRLGATAGEVSTTATVPDLPGVLFTSTADAGTGPQLIIATQPSSAAKKDVPFAQQPVIRVEDGTGEPLGAGIAVTVSVEGATLAGTTILPSDGYGEVRFTDLVLSGPDGTYNLTFSAPDLIAVRSIAITLTSAAAGGQIVITTQPSSAAENGDPFDQQPAVRVENGDGSNGRRRSARNGGPFVAGR